ncbi:hypothetical protein RUM43_011821 [Polyplax serrata]|uniref:Uncharacterized protein n=1 Tax=Polyplax serrata TaxID=468196 RepID=A0AAN8Q3D9_POLSC
MNAGASRLGVFGSLDSCETSACWLGEALGKSNDRQSEVVLNELNRQRKGKEMEKSRRCVVERAGEPQPS